MIHPTVDLVTNDQVQDDDDEDEDDEGDTREFQLNVEKKNSNLVGGDLRNSKIKSNGCSESIGFLLKWTHSLTWNEIQNLNDLLLNGQDEGLPALVNSVFSFTTNPD